MPKFSELFGEGRRGEIANIVDGSSVLLSSIYVPAALGIAALSPMILELLGGYQYDAPYPIMPERSTGSEYFRIKLLPGALPLDG